jgi:hypothetical protein
MGSVSLPIMKGAFNEKSVYCVEQKKGDISGFLPIKIILYIAKNNN